MSHETYMRRCFQLALNGKGYVAPNPMVGSVIVYQDKIIGEGYHQKFGEAHAEVNAINSVQDKELLKDSTIYVSLEPCSHFGKTPPCADLIVKHQIPRVVIGCSDSFSEVSGKGIERLRNAGIDVLVGVLEAESRKLNERFFTFHEKKRPYVILKWAQTADGFIDRIRTKTNGSDQGIFWISEPGTKRLVHQWRHEEAGILTGWKTIATDNPKLTCREVSGTNPVRIIIDPQLILDYNAFSVGDRSAKTLILTSRAATGDENLQFLNPKDFTVPSILNELWNQDIQSVIIEGGKTTLNYFIVAGLWDEARIITGTKSISEGVKAPGISGKAEDLFFFGNDQIQILKNA